ncbi:diacylglycerol/lipid kinase family protein [Ramlibacter sp. MMS24-I3-19]|uniref:diacylglycerol/lipid kinase family protein n=1 Tax=Ramlibacter sp. MMS24-I3-19 TaxID=3416606 RepID=UPI003D03E450
MKEPTARSAVVLLNAKSGQGCPPEMVASLQDKLAQRGLVAQVVLFQDGSELLAAAARASSDGVPLVIAAGGDGTVSAVASQLAGTATVLGVLPMGTLNHFAKDLGLPMDLDAALDVLAGGRTVAVDVGEVNGRVFINNSSIGIYPDIVLDRERQRRRLGRGKWPALAVACLNVLRRHPSMYVELQVEGERLLRRSPFVFIGNNRYEVEGFAIGSRTALDTGRLSLYMAHHGGRFGLLRLALLALLQRLRQADDFEMLEAAELVIRPARRRIRVAADGEVLVMQTPLQYRVRPGALRVRAPSQAPA